MWALSVLRGRRTEGAYSILTELWTDVMIQVVELVNE